MSWAIVIGVDDYGEGAPRLHAAVDDAEAFHEWVVSESGGNVPSDNVCLLLGRARDDPDRSGNEWVPTKDNVVAAINKVMAASGGVGEALYFFFSGHGITATYANREESALVMPGYDRRHTDQTLAVRSIAEFFETTQFGDQFFFIDACRTALPPSEAEIGAWPIPRRRNPGQPPVQQFVFYATSPGLTALEAGWPDELSAFTQVLMSGLKGTGRAKAWSWERNCYEVRWERLATYVKDEMELKRLPTERPPDVPPGGWPFQIPQDVGIRGVAGRDRDARLVSLPSRGVKPVVLTVELKADRKYDEAEVNVLDANSEPVATALKVTGTSHMFTLPPKTYAVRATTLDEQVGRLIAPVELYDNCTTAIKLEQRGAPDTADGGDGTIEIRSPDPLAVADIRDETGQVLGVRTAGSEYIGPPGFYRVRHLGPEAEKTGEEQFVVLGGGQREPVELSAAAPEAHVCSLAKALGGGSEKDYVIPAAGAGPVAWAQPSTVVVAGIGAALQDGEALRGLGLESPLAALGEQGVGVAFYAVAGDGDGAALENLSVRVWPSGSPVPDETTPLAAREGGVAAVVTPSDEPQPHWLSIEPKDAEPTVVALPGLSGRLATVVAQVDPDRVRLYQLHPVAGPADSSKPDRLRRVEHLERLLLGGRVDGAQTLAEEVAAEARDDPFAGCLAGYVLLRLGRYERLGDLASDIVAVAPKLSDAFILRGEYEAHAQNVPAANQAFAEAVSAGVPAFGEGLTRLVEGLRVSGFNHPRGSLVRYIFQRHARGSMWAAFTPRRKLEPGRLVITGADIGFEG